VNPYTRRSELHWTLGAAAALVVSMAVAIGLLVTAETALVPDLAARQVAVAADGKLAPMAACVRAADKLVTEVDVFKSAAKAARLQVESAAAAAPPPRRRGRAAPAKAPDLQLAWPAAAPSHKQARALAPCRTTIEASAGADRSDAEAWNAVLAAATVETPKDDDKPAQVAAAQRLLTVLGEAPLERLANAAKRAEADLRAVAEQARKHAETATVRAPRPGSVLSREVAIALGVGLSIVALAMSFASMQAASKRRRAALAPLREIAQTRERGLQVATLLKLAAKPNGGEPGLVLGAALGGLIAALIRPLTPDLFVAGVMTGLPLGLGVQWATRLLGDQSHWRRRVKELSDVEKPTIPTVLVVSGVDPGLEEEFLRFFEALSLGEQAATVEKLAAQAEAKILAMAEQASAQPPGA
jgi:hypothetical protein